MGIEVPYESAGRVQQKARTHAAMIESARKLMAAGADPTIEEVAAAAGISRTTAYRYFKNREDLLVAAYPKIERVTLLPDPAPTDVRDRLDLVMTEFMGVVTGWEPQLRAALRLSLDPSHARSGALRQGRAIGWIAEALTPLTPTHPHIDQHELAIAIRAATGIESYVWLVDVAGLTSEQATQRLRTTAQAVLEQALQAR